LAAVHPLSLRLPPSEDMMSEGRLTKKFMGDTATGIWIT
jgi:hypothetical protein